MQNYFQIGDIDNYSLHNKFIISVINDKSKKMAITLTK